MPVLKRLEPSDIVLTATTGAAAPGVRSWVCVRACVHECASECVCARAHKTPSQDKFLNTVHMPPGPNKNVVSGFCEKEPPTLKQKIGAGSNFFRLQMYVSINIYFISHSFVYKCSFCVFSIILM